jgi:hypothetical protein
MTQEAYAARGRTTIGWVLRVGGPMPTSNTKSLCTRDCGENTYVKWEGFLTPIVSGR